MIKPTLIFLTACLLSACAATERQFNADWTSYQYDVGRNGFVSEAPRPPLKLRWTFPTEGRIVQPPVVAQGQVFVSSRDGRLYVLDLETGSKQWDVDLGPGGFTSSPTWRPEALYGTSGEERYLLHALNLSNGDNLWQRESGELINRIPWVVVDETQLYSHVDPDLNASEDIKIQFAALDNKTGQTNWKQPLPGVPRVAPTLADNTVLVACDNETLYALDRAKGTILWQASLGGLPASAPLVRDGKAYLSTQNGFVSAFDTSTGKVIWRYQYPQMTLQGNLALSGDILLIPGTQFLHSYNVKELEKAWQYRITQEMTAPVASREYVYFGSASRALIVLDLVTGTLKGTYRVADEVLASPVLVGGLVLVGASDGKLYAFDEVPAPQVTPAPQKTPLPKASGWMQRRW